MKFLYSKNRQVGVIRFGGGLNARWWIEDARKQGYKVLIVEGGALLYSAR